MTVLTWNIRNGGGTRLPRIVEEIAAHDPDVIGLGGYRAERAKMLRTEFRERGWGHVETSEPGEGENGIAVFSRTPLRKRRYAAPGGMRPRWLDVDLPEYGFGIGVMQIPAAVGSLKGPAAVAKRRLWDAVLEQAWARREEAFLFAGSWNTGAHRVDEKGKTYVCAEQFGKLAELGWCDLWRQFHPGLTEWTWYSNQGNGFRVDHAFASPRLAARVIGCRYSHAERVAKVSDHSLVIVEVA